MFVWTPRVAGVVTAVVINPCSGSNNQRWDLTDSRELESVAFPGQCLIQQGDFLFVHLDPCLNSIAQHSAIQSNGLVTSDFRGCLAVLGGPNPGTFVSTRWCNADAPEQQWDNVA